MTKLIDRTDEKLAIAKEFGLESSVSVLEHKKAVKEITNMKFKRITKEKIASYFPKFAWDWSSGFSWQEKIVLSIAPFVVFGLIALGTACFGDASDKKFWLAFLGIGIAPFLICLLISLAQCVRKVRVASMDLKNWKDEIPYGAFLALKEAKESGVQPGWSGQYLIYYPRLEEKIKADPVITGFYRGVEVEIFAWDDRKVYE